MEKIKKIVLAYSGGLDTSVILKWLKEKYNAEIIAFCADVGQEEELKGLKEKAIKTGADRCYISNLVEEFAGDFIFPMIRAGAIYENQYYLGTSIARPLIAKKQIEIAKAEKADAVAHGATGKGNDQCRFEFTYYALKPDIKIIAPWREWEFRGRKDLIGYAKTHNIAVPVTKQKPYSTDRNLLHISYESGILEDPWNEPPEDIFILSVSPQDAPDRFEHITLDFEDGNCIALNNKKISPANIIKNLNKIGGKNGIGRTDTIENRFVGMKSRGVYETPGGAILHFAHRQIETLTQDREIMHLKDSLIPKYSELIYYGFWFSPERIALQSFIDCTQKNVTGTVRLKLYKGNIILAGRKSVFSLYNPRIATMESDEGAYNQKDAEGFINLNAIRLKAWARVRTIADNLPDDA